MMTVEQLGPNQTIVRFNGHAGFFSYRTLVAVRSGLDCYITNQKYSATTTRHINRFLAEQGVQTADIYQTAPSHLQILFETVPGTWPAPVG